MRCLLFAVVLCGAAFAASTTPVAYAAEPAAACTSSVGPGIPPPASVPSGLPGFHAAWYGQSGYPTLCPGERSTATVAYYNSGSFGWVRGRMGEMAFLGTSDPIPGQDNPSPLGGSGGASPATGWPRDNRVAAQPADYVGPGQVAWFQFTIQAPATPGSYRLHIRPLIEGAMWMEDVGVYWQVTVKEADSVGSIAVSPTSSASTEASGSRAYTAAVGGASGCLDLALIDDASYPATVAGGLTDADANGRADLSTAATFTLVNGAGRGTSYVDCAAVPADGTVTFVVSSTVPNTNVRPVVFRDENSNNALDVSAAYLPSEPWGLGGTARFIPAEAATGAHNVTALAVVTSENYFTDAGATATYRYDGNDTFRRSGAGISLAQFEQLLSRGDSLSVSYQADDVISSTFDITLDLGHDAPTVDASVDSWDGGPTQNDVGLQIAEPPTNSDGLAYTIQRAAVGVGTGCDPGAAYLELTLQAFDTASNAMTYVDRNLAVGAYCYRVGATDPVTLATAFGYSQRVVINNPPTPVALPRALDARVTTSGGVLSALDAGDIIKIGFDKAMRSPLGFEFRAQDANGTIADVRCLASEQTCTLNSAAETLGGVAYPANTLVTIVLRTDPRLVVAGATAGLQLNVTVTGGSFLDVAGNAWDVSASDDVTLGAPD